LINVRVEYAALRLLSSDDGRQGTPERSVLAGKR